MTNTTSGLTTRTDIKIGDRVTGRCVTMNTTYTGRVTEIHPAERYALADTGETYADGNPVEPIVEMAHLAAKITLADSLRQLADLFDRHPELAEAYRFPDLTEHQFGDEAAILQTASEALGLDVEHHVHKSGARFSVVETKVGVITFKLQADTGDFDAATNPNPRLHWYSVDCWCNPDFDEAGQFFKHTNVNGVPASFEPSIVPGAEVDADGYPSEDHR